MKKIVIFSSIGGGGHVSIVQSLKASLGDIYQITLVETFQDVLFANSCFKGKYCPVLLYNYALQKNMIFLCNIFLALSKFFFSFQTKKWVNSIGLCLKRERPDLVISVIPAVNYYIALAAHELNIPFLIVSSDIAIDLYVNHFKSYINDKLYVALPFDHEESNLLLHEMGVDDDHIAVVGASINPIFLQEKEKEVVKKKWGIDNDFPTILLIMGAQGSRLILDYCKQLVKVKKTINLLICTGKNQALVDTIKKFNVPKNIYLQTISFTKDIDELMTIADILITKSGSLSVCEGIYKNVPLLLDATTTVLTLEKPNHLFIAEHDFGESLTNINNVASRIDYLLNHSEIGARWRHNMHVFEKKNSQQEIPVFIAKILQ